MNVNKMIKKLAILAILAMFLTLNFSTTTLGKFEKLNDEGIWIDEFSDAKDISELNKCVNEIGKIKLKKGTPETTYNYEEYPDNVKAWYRELGITGGGLLGDFINQFISPLLAPGIAVEKTDMSLISKIDDECLTTESIGSDVYVFSPMHHFQFKIKQKIDDINKITLKWFFGSYQPVDEVNLKEISMWVWTYDDILPRWTQVDSIVYNQSNVGGIDGDKPDLTYTLTKKMLYISDDGYVDILIVGTPKNSNENAILSTDYVEAKVTTTYGYLTEGYIISSVIEPPDFGGWEKVFWSGTKATETTSITIQVLDKDKNIIEGFSSKTSPLDISSITATGIRLKAILRSSASDVTPLLDNWGVMWQKKEGYTDSFSYTYRVGKADGVTVKNGEVKINEFYGDWSIFGKNPANTRAYVGAGLTSKPEDLYWYSKGYNVGGGFRLPVTSNGKVYVASGDKKIYVFNETADSKTGKQTPVTSTKVSYEVDACIAATDKLLIIGTCMPNKANKIYALDLSNLSKVEWSYSPNSETICFSSPPTIDNGRIFITSWSGLLWDLPITSVLSKFLSLNNKLIALDVSTGNPLWDPITLPAGSLSAPAVGNNMVFVGCQNMWGSSLFAYDIDTGKEIWNTSVGIIGRSSPVYADGKVFVLTREKKNISSYGENKIVAVDANSGDELWNKTLPGNTTTSLLNLLKGPNFYWLISGTAPISTPAYADDTLFVLSPDGEFIAFDPDTGDKKWSYELVDNSIITHYVTSPIVASSKVYVVTGGGTVYVFNTINNDNESVEPLWSYQIERPNWIPPWVDVVASPIISNGVLIVSATEDTIDLTGGLYCIGGYSPTSTGELLSTSIHVPKGYWWNEFNATMENTTENNTIIFSILNNDNVVLKTIENLDGVENKISGIRSNVIKLKAFFEIGNFSESTPVLNSWMVNWVEEKKPPEFINDSFEPSEKGWINMSLPECSIEVRDLSYNSVLSGLDTDTAKYRIGYTPKGSDTSILSKWYPAVADDESGVTQTRIRAKLQDLKIGISELKNITFAIKDLAGNEAISNTISFKMDTLKPWSHIKNINLYKSQYNKPFTIEAEANDTGDSSVRSGVGSVTLKYRNSTDGENYGEWETFGTPRLPSIYSWEFGKINNEPMKGGYYQVVTVAKDLAGNEEEIDENKINEDSITFLFDMTPPSLENQFETVYKVTHLPVFDLKLYDDYKLDSISYRFDAGDWIKIKSDINEAVFNITWSLPETLWESMRINEEHSVFFKITDALGNEYITTDKPLTIMKDENISKFYVDLTNFHEWHWDDKFTITAKYPEDVSVENIKLYYKYSTDNKNWPDQWIQYGDNSQTIAPFKWVFTAVNGSGYYKFKTEITDTAGIVYTSPVETINVTIFPTTLFMLMIILTIILILSTATIFLKIKKERKKSK